MKINTGFIAIREISYDSLKGHFSFPKTFNGSSRFVEIIGTTKNSLFKKGEIAIHEKAIPYFYAKDLGDSCFYIPENELNAKLVNGNIISIFELVYIDVDKKSKHTIDFNGSSFKIDEEYDPFRVDLVTQHGKVLSVPLSATNSYIKDYKIEIDIEIGDTVYAHHFLTHQDNETVFDDKKVYSIRYEDCYCRIRNGEYKMLNEWNFLKPIVESRDSLSVGDFIIKHELDNNTKIATIKYQCEKLKSNGVNIGDTVYFRKDCDYRIDIDGEILYRVNSRDIFAKD